MKFAKTDISRIAKEMLGFFDERHIVNPSSFREMIGHDYFFDTERFVEVRLANSNLGTKAITCAYWIKGSGNPLNVKINIPLEYYQVILKSVDLMEGYKRFPALID